MKNIVTIKKNIHGGQGLAKLKDGCIVMVPGAIKGETVDLRITGKKRHYLTAAATEILTPDPHRVTPPCPQYGQCGGCNLQHADYPLQLHIKTEIIKELLRRSTSQTLQEAAENILPLMEASPQLGYRQRIRLQVNKKQQIGFFGFQSHSLVPVDHCLLAGKEINLTLTALRQQRDFAALLCYSNSFEILLNPVTARTVCMLNLTRKPGKSDLKKGQNLINSIPTLENLIFTGDMFANVSPLSGSQPHLLSWQFHNSTKPENLIVLSWEAGAFSQVHLQQNQNLINQVLSFCQPHRDMTMLDLFCGSGNFSIPLAMQVKSVLGLEGQGAAIRSCRHNAQLAGLDNCEFKKTDVTSGCRDLEDKGSKFDTVIIDPPRQGIPDTARLLARLTERRLIYISCDPTTLCRDLEQLTGCGFILKKIQPLDMFPQTHHTETVALLEKN